MVNLTAPSNAIAKNKKQKTKQKQCHTISESYRQNFDYLQYNKRQRQHKCLTSKNFQARTV